MTRPVNVLFLCTGNSARSILSEALLNDLGRNEDGSPRFLAWSAGSKPSGQPHPEGLAELKKQGHVTSLYRSKSWDEYSQSGAPEFDIVVTVCDNAAAEVCPVFFGPGLKVHWPQADPAHVEPLSARQAAFARTYEICKARVEALLALSETELRDHAAVQAIADIEA
jgi:arsenate reductase